MHKTNHPKTGFNTLPSIFLESVVPTTIPAIESVAIFVKKTKSTATPSIISDEKPILEFMAMIKSEVPMVCFMSRFAKKSNAGIMIKPPPAPKKPIKIPTKNPIIASLYLLLFKGNCFETFDFLIINAAELSIRIAKITKIKLFLRTVNCFKNKKELGISGKINFRISNNEKTDGIANINADLKCKFFDL